MKIIDKLRDYVGNDGYDDEMKTPEADDEENYEEDPQEDKRAHMSKRERVGMNTASMQYSSQKPSANGFVVFYPQHYHEVKEIADQLIAGKTVLLNLETTPREEARRLVDFLSGVAYARGGEPKRVSTATFIITSSKVDVEGADLYDTEDDGSMHF